MPLHCHALRVLHRLNTEHFGGLISSLQLTACLTAFHWLQVAHQTAKLTNVSLERARFTVHKPQAPLQVSCAVGPLAAGMERDVKVSFTGKEVGDFIAELHVSSEINTFAVTVSAKVVPSVSHLESQDSGSMFASDTGKQEGSLQQG